MSLVDVDKLNKTVVIMNNAAAMSANNLSLNEQRVLMIAMSKINFYKNEDVANRIVRITAEEVSLFCKVNLKTAYQALSDAIDEDDKRGIANRWIRFNGRDLDRVKKRGVDTSRARWIDKVYEYPQQGYIEVRFTEDAMLLLKKLATDEDGMFTVLNLVQTLKLSSDKSLKLFIALSRFRNKGLFFCSIDEYRFLMGIPESYEQFKSINSRYILPQVKEINTKLKIDLTVKYKKTGSSRSTNFLEFKFDNESMISAVKKKSINQKIAITKNYVRSITNEESLDDYQKSNLIHINYLISDAAELNKDSLLSQYEIEEYLLMSKEFNRQQAT